MTSLENRNSSALFKRAEQLKRWQESDTNHEPSEPKRKSQRIQFTDGCVFLAACAASDKDEVERLLKRGADIDTANIDGLTALHQVSNLEKVHRKWSHTWCSAPDLDSPLKNVNIHSFGQIWQDEIVILIIFRHLKLTEIWIWAISKWYTFSQDHFEIWLKIEIGEWFISKIASIFALDYLDLKTSNVLEATVLSCIKFANVIPTVISEPKNFNAIYYYYCFNWLGNGCCKASLKRKKRYIKGQFLQTLLWAATSIFSCISPDLQRWHLFQPSFLYHKR